ncbi:hypothetical protein GH714_031862 [Hevea brasiliensis]|uniref:Leucine-rich repeat-containing N-terminal plant-type domain-containing protein n=1 Tax=Hevea brasiliensis TaxID=3981 RepID=A0A6A6N8M6_HEVBR|nr:hypothetical protein GH714_031862 [Hevea brasiliensis]
MAFYNIASSINLTILATIIFFYTASNASTSLANVTSQPSSLQLEGKALLDSGWWKSCTNVSSFNRKWSNAYCDVIVNSRSYCNWPGITCNSAGSVTEIYPPLHLNIGNKFRKLNFSCFPNLTVLYLRGHRISDKIPPQLGALTKLRWRDTYSSSVFAELRTSGFKLNNLTGTIPDFDASLHKINFSFNNFTGPIPCNLSRRFPIDSFVGNKGLYRDEINNVCFSPPASIGSANSNKWMHYSRSFFPLPCFLPSLFLDHYSSIIGTRSRIHKLRQKNQEMGTYSQYGTMMAGLPLKMSLKQLRISTLDTALELVAMGVFIRHNFLAAE